MVFQHGYLFRQWLWRELAGRYRGSLLGLAWPVLQPLLQIAVFTLIFHDFMQLRWPGVGATGGGALEYALNVGAGLAVFNYFAEVLSRAPQAVLAQPNLVTKVRFPLALLPAVTVGAALVHVAVGCAALLLFAAALGRLSLVALWLPLFLLPLLLYGLALAWLLGALGVFLRDIAQAMPALTSVLMFLTPIFYPASAVPPSMALMVQANPIAWGAEALRALLLQGQLPALQEWGVHLAVATAALLLARQVFARLSGGFADVL